MKLLLGAVIAFGALQTLAGLGAATRFGRLDRAVRDRRLTAGKARNFKLKSGLRALGGAGLIAGSIYFWPTEAPST